MHSLARALPPGCSAFGVVDRWANAAELGFPAGPEADGDGDGEGPFARAAAAAVRSKVASS
jgi:hypothetical protein